MSIQELFLKIKGLKDTLERQDIFMVLTLVLVGFISFGLGRISSTDSAKSPIAVIDSSKQISGIGESVVKNTETTNPPKTTENFAVQNSEQVVASKSGTKYHFPWCSGAKSIKEENKVWFDSIEEAKSAGYSPASNCKGLK